MRAFIAAPVPRPLADRLARGAADARSSCPDARWTPPDRLHLTFRFLGDITAECAGRIGAGLAGLSATAAVPVRPAGSGGFPSAARACVWWAGLDGGAALTRLAAAVAEIATGSGDVASEDRPFVPHITIARFHRPRDIRTIDLWGGSGETGGEVCLLSRVVLLESRLSPAGPSYTALRDIRLAVGERAGS